MKKEESKTIIKELISLHEYADEWNKKYHSVFSQIRGKWIYFNDKDYPSHHGRVVDAEYVFPLYVRSKNGCIRYVNPEDIIAIFDTKKECFDYKPEVGK